MSLRLKLVLFISFLFISAVGNAVFTFKLEEYGDEKLKWVNQANEVLLEIQIFLGHLTDMETGQRGYLLTEDVSYLEPYYTGLNHSEIHIENLKKLTQDNALQQERLEEVMKTLKLKFDELEETIKLTQENHSNKEKVLEIVRQNHGKRYMDTIREVLNELTQTELILLETRKGDFRENRAKITTLITIEIMFFIFLAFMTFAFLNKNLFAPLNMLLSSTHKIEKGEKIEFKDLTSNDEMGYLLSSFLRMTEKIEMRTTALDYAAHHDDLTGIQNRVGLQNELDSDISSIKGTETKLAILFLDLNKFKQLNDTLGHHAGDIILKETAIRLKKSIRSDDIVFRLGGDEFLILIKKVSHRSEIEKIIVVV